MKKLTKKQIVALSITAGVILLWIISYACIKGAMEKQLEKLITSQTSYPAKVDIGSDMFSILGGNLRFVKADIHNAAKTEYCRVILKGLKLNIKDQDKSRIKSADFDIKLSEAAFADQLINKFKQQHLQLSNGYVYLTMNKYTVIGVLTASGNQMYFKVVDSNSGLEASVIESKINPIHINQNINFRRFEYNSGYYYISGSASNLTGLNGI